MGISRAALGGALILLGVPAGRGVSVPEILVRFDRVCSESFWPGFEPCRIPLAIFDGEKTWLVRHPGAPAGFAPWEGRTDVRVFPGRHASVTANTSVKLDGVTTASALLTGRSGDPKSLAALLVHETFHVFQAERHPRWGANEADLFLYPTDDAAALAARRLESIALARALASGHRGQAAGWAARALEVRAGRFARLPAASQAYERASEIREGLARYVQWKAGGDAEPLFPEREFAAGEVRDRAYASGAAMALLLDRFDPAWKGKLEADDARTLEDLLREAVRAEPPESFRSGEAEREKRRAAVEVGQADARRGQIRRDLLEGPGWKLVIEPKEPLQAERFDPLNVERVGPSEVLHRRFLRLANSDGTVEVLGRRCLTESAGKHPLFEGVRRATIELPGPPRIERDAGRIRISADGVTLDYRGGLTTRGQVYIIH